MVWEGLWKKIKNIDWRKALKCYKMARFIYKNRNSLEERWLRIWAEIEGLYDQMKEEWNKE